MGYYKNIPISSDEVSKYSNVSLSSEGLHAKVYILDDGTIDENSYSRSYLEKIKEKEEKKIKEVIDKELKKARKSEKTISNDGCLMKIVKAPFRFLWWLIKKTFVILSLGLLSGVLNSDKK